MRSLRASAVAVSAAVTLLAGTSYASAAVVADWGMNETSGTVMHDRTANHINGKIGSDVVIGVSAPDGSRAYRFQGKASVVNDNRLVRVPDNGRLDPGTTTFSVTLRVKTGAHNANIIQKGQALSTGGYWKFVIQRGWPRCHYQDGAGRQLAVGFVGDDRPATKVDDSTWHTITCTRTAKGVRVGIDGIRQSNEGNLGTIGNKAPLVIGGKLECNGQDVSCDYFSGVMDWVRIRKG